MMFRGRPGRLLNVLCTVSLHPVSTGLVILPREVLNFNTVFFDRPLLLMPLSIESAVTTIFPFFDARV